MTQLRYWQQLTATLCAIWLIDFAVIPCSLADPPGPDRASTATTSVSASQAPAATRTQTATASAGSDRAPAKATTAEAEPSATRTILSQLDPSISFYYARSVANYDSSDFGHSLGFIGALDYNPLPSLVLSTDLALYRELGEEYERFVASNWNFSATRTFDLAPAGVLYPTFFFSLPTNPDDREYLTYRGSLGLDVELRKFSFYDFSDDHALGGSIGFATTRNLYQSTTSEGGFPNRIWQVSGYASLSYKFKKSLVLVLKFRNNWLWNPDGARADDVYRLSAAVNYSPIEQLWLALSTVSAGTTFLYDQVTPNVHLYSAEATSVVFSLTYVPRLSITNELSR